MSKGKIKYINTNAKLEEACEVLFKSQVIGLDTETSGLSGSDYIALIQLSCKQKDSIISYVINAMVNLDIRLIYPLLMDRRWIKAIHNASFYVRFIRQTWGIDAQNIWCTKLAENRAVGRGQSKCRGGSLAALMKHHFDIEVEKSRRSE